MDTSEYLSMFLAESREHLDTLNQAVLRIEEQPDDRETLDEIFRAAHSLKGMSATMGFERVAALTHRMEDVFEVLRGRPEGLPREGTDVLFQCLDALSAAIDSIDATGAEQLDPSGLIARLTGLIVEQPAISTQEPAAPVAAAVEPPAAVLAAAREGRVLQVTATLAPDVMMPSVRAYMVLAAAGDHGAVIDAVPAQEHVDAFDGRTVTAWVTSDHETDVLRTALAAVPDVAAAAVEELAAGAPQEDPAQPAERRRTDDGPAPPKRTSSTVRVDADRLDALMHLMGELVVDRTAVESLAQDAHLPALTEAVAGLTRSSQALQALVMQVRMIPVEAVFMRFPRLVRDLSTKLGKHVELALTGTETELDRTVVDALGDPLVHLVRNSLDHALEPPDERRAAGKPETGRIEISARHAGGNVVITVRDDGRGVDPERVARKAVARGLIAQEQAGSVDMQWAIDLLFTAGFSTAEQTSDISGRGVGMDAVRTQIRELGGAVMMTSEQGGGTSVQIRLPLTLAIMPALLTQSGGTPFAVPLERVERTLSLAQQTVRSVTGRRMLVLGDGVLPLIDLADALGYPPHAGGDHVVLVRGAERRIALVVDQLIGQRELVTRPLPAAVGDDLALSGGAVLADGSIALIVDCDALAEQMARAPRAADTRITQTFAHAA
ncbi:MAG TPA: chemotaxis protein CheA [Gaiellales bacterium]|nr:chemotaxis protein CheA [Gaiellales bacterium]